MKKQEANKKHELLHVVITDANTGETLVDEKSTLFAGVITEKYGCKTLVIGGGNYSKYVNVAERLIEASEEIIDFIKVRARKEEEDQEAEEPEKSKDKEGE